MCGRWRGVLELLFTPPSFLVIGMLLFGRDKLKAIVITFFFSGKMEVIFFCGIISFFCGVENGNLGMVLHFGEVFFYQWINLSFFSLWLRVVCICTVLIFFVFVFFFTPLFQ